MPNPIVTDELALLEQVSRVLAETPAPASPSEEALVRELERIRELLVSGTEEKDRPALGQQWDRYSALLAQLRRSSAAPAVDPASPYFAHLRLREEGRERDLCLGKATRIGAGVRIVDWRNAPISRVFYRYEQGDEYEEQVAGRTLAGVVVARRTVAIRGGVLERVEAPEGAFVRDSGAPEKWRRETRDVRRLGGGEGAAMRVYQSGETAGRRLGTGAEGARGRYDKRLPDIAGLIDPQQFELIARPSAGLVVVRGSAGSGKTTVALHRIAYLAYDDPAIDSPSTLFVAFSSALCDYVGHLLPALGVERVQVRTFRDWAAAQRRRLYPQLPRAVRYDSPSLIRRLKLHPALGDALHERRRRVPGEPSPAQAMDDWASVLAQPALLEEVFERTAPGAFGTDELRRASEWCRERNDEVFAHLDGEADVEAELDPEDDALLLRAWQLRVGPIPARARQPLRYRHVAIDEVQDCSPLEVQVLLDCLDERRSATLAGDTQQHVMQDAGFSSWSEFFAHLGLEGTEVQTLRVSYRSPREIVEFARALLGDLQEDDEPPRAVRSGPPVELFQFTDHGACVAFLADALKRLAREEPLASVAVLTGSRAISDLYAEGLGGSEVPRLRQVRDQDFVFAPGVEVTEIEQAKGLEFDYVILADVSEQSFPDRPAARRLLHVGATRAVHQLWVTSAGPLSRLAREAPGQG